MTQKRPRKRQSVTVSDAEHGQRQAALDARAADAKARLDAMNAKNDALRAKALRRARWVGRAVVSILEQYVSVAQAAKDSKGRPERKAALRALLASARKLEPLGERIVRVMARLNRDFPFATVSVMAYLEGIKQTIDSETPWSVYNDVTRAMWGTTELWAKEQQKLFFAVLEERIEAMP